MSVRGYAAWNPGGETAAWFRRVESVVAAYCREWPLSNRQLFYRMVAEHGYRKDEKAYGKLVDMVSRGRRAGLLDWRAIRDGGLGTGQDSMLYDDADDFVESAVEWASEAQLDRQEGQAQHIELWCEAGGMLPILRSVAHPYGCRANTGGGYDSVTAKHQLALRAYRRAALRGVPTLILHVGDFDPSGEDMCAVLREDAGAMAATQVLRAVVREHKKGDGESWPSDAPWDDVALLVADNSAKNPALARLWRWCNGWLSIERVALTGEQVIDRDVITAPPKKSDSRMEGFIQNNRETVDALGTRDISAQLEALTPVELRELIREVIEGHLDMGAYEAVLDAEEPFHAELRERLSNA